MTYIRYILFVWFVGFCFAAPLMEEMAKAPRLSSDRSMLESWRFSVPVVRY